MPTNTILLTPRKSLAKQFIMLHPVTVSSNAEIRASLPNVGKDTLWISDDERKIVQLLKAVSWPTKRLGRAVLLFRPALDALTALRQCFDPMVFGSDGGFLQGEELGQVLAAENRHDLFIGGTVDEESETVTLWRGNLDSLVVPFSAFPPSGDGISPDFGDFAVADYGQTVRFGEYEAATEAIVYEYDAEYRRRIRKERCASERTLGASIRRLRKQRGLRREDFKPLAEKTLARIEQGLVTSVQKRTLSTIAKVLGVTPQELATY